MHHGWVRPFHSLPRLPLTRDSLLRTTLLRQYGEQGCVHQHRTAAQAGISPVRRRAASRHQTHGKILPAVATFSAEVRHTGLRSELAHVDDVNGRGSSVIFPARVPSLTWSRHIGAKICIRISSARAHQTGVIHLRRAEWREGTLVPSCILGSIQSRPGEEASRPLNLLRNRLRAVMVRSKDLRPRHVPLSAPQREQ